DAQAPPERLREAARDYRRAAAAAGGGEVDVGGARDAARAGLAQLIDQAVRFLDPPLRLGGARLGALAQPLDLAAHRVGQGVLVGGLAGQELVAAGEELAAGGAGLA